jgi:hypothetical protein
VERGDGGMGVNERCRLTVCEHGVRLAEVTVDHGTQSNLHKVDDCEHRAARMSSGVGAPCRARLGRDGSLFPFRATALRDRWLNLG